MKLLEWLRKAAPLGLPVLASIAAVVLLAESYSVSAKLENYERLRADHRSLITTVAEKRRDADEASANLARVTGDLNAANEGIRRISAERESALKETAEARAAHAFTDEQRRQIEERKTALQTDIETKKVELSQAQGAIATAGEQLANIKRAITSEQAQLTDAQSQARVATEDATRFKRLATEAGSRIGDIDKLSSEATSRLAILQRDVKDAQTVIGEAAALRGQILQTRKERESAEREFADLQQRRMTLQGEVTRLQSQSTELAAKVNQQNMSISGLDQKYRELQEQLATAEVALQSARAEEVERRGSIKAISADLGRIKQETSELEPRQAALALATSQLATVQEQITSRQREAAAAAVQASQLNDQITHRQGELDLLNKTIAATMRQRDTLNAELPQLEKSKTALRAEIFDFEWRRRQLNSEVTQPPENLASQLKYWRWNGKE